MPASYNGLDLGVVFVMNVAANPNARQVTAYPGANGLEVVDLGTRGGTTIAEFGFFAANAAALASAEGTLRALQLSGQPYTLVDTRGTSWANVILEDFRPIGPARPVAGMSGYVCQKYGAQFLHI